MGYLSREYPVISPQTVRHLSKNNSAKGVDKSGYVYYNSMCMKKRNISGARNLFRFCVVLFMEVIS